MKTIRDRSITLAVYSTIGLVIKDEIDIPHIGRDLATNVITIIRPFRMIQSCWQLSSRVIQNQNKRRIFNFALWV